MNDKKRKAMWASKGNHDNNLVDEVVLVSENDGDFYRQRLNPISDMFERKMKSGKFRKENALFTKSLVDSVGNIHTGFLEIIWLYVSVVSGNFSNIGSKSNWIAIKWARIVSGSDEPMIPSKCPRILSKG